MDTYFPEAPQSLKNRQSPGTQSGNLKIWARKTHSYIRFVCDIDVDAENHKIIGTLSLVSEVTDGLNVGHYRAIQVMDDNQEYFDRLYYRDIQTAVKVCVLLASGKEVKEVKALKPAYAQPDTSIEWANQVEHELK